MNPKPERQYRFGCGCVGLAKRKGKTRIVCPDHGKPAIAMFITCPDCGQTLEIKTLSRQKRCKDCQTIFARENKRLYMKDYRSRKPSWLGKPRKVKLAGKFPKNPERFTDCLSYEGCLYGGAFDRPSGGCGFCVKFSRVDV